MHFIPADIPGLVRIEPDIHEDARGFFAEMYRANLYAAAGIDTEFVQENRSGSRKDVLRGLHYQVRQAQGKLVTVNRGTIYDVAVDLRQSSPAYGRWFGMMLDGERQQRLWIPPGFAHGFLVMSEWAEMTYLATAYYAPEWQRTIRWNDPDIGIEWPLEADRQPILSESDAAGVPFVQAETYDTDTFV